MNVLLVYPQHPRNTYWSFSHAMPLIRKRSAMPPLALATIAGMLPADCAARLVDMNIEPLRDADLQWADAIFTSTMIVQEPSLREVLARAREFGVPVIAGGPHPSSAPQPIPGATTVRGEAEVILPLVLADLREKKLQPVYEATGWPELDATPVPRFDLLKLDAYACMAVQYSRGCPYHCEFCDIWKLYGRNPRVKPTHRFVAELNALHAAGWRGSVFIVDDNFIGRPKQVKRLLTELTAWQRERGYPFAFFTEASVNVAHDDDLLAGLHAAGFNMLFVGIESPQMESLVGAGKMQNTRHDLLTSVRRIQAAGLEVSAGFIVGFDEDPPDICRRQARFIDTAGIPMAMVGMLSALPGTDLYDRLVREGRLLAESVGNNTHQLGTNFQTKLPASALASDYMRLISELYEPTLERYYGRCRKLLNNLGDSPLLARRVRFSEWLTFAAMLAAIPFRRHQWQTLKFLLWAALRHPRRFAEAVGLAVTGIHLEAVTRGSVASAQLAADCATALAEFQSRVAALKVEASVTGRVSWRQVRQVYRARRKAVRGFQRRIARLEKSFRPDAAAALAQFAAQLDALLAAQLPAERSEAYEFLRWLEQLARANSLSATGSAGT